MKLPTRELAAFILPVLLIPFVVHAQTLNPSYLSEMPAPARILAEIKGKDSEDTGERQMGAFMALIKMMDDMAWGLEHRYVDMADTRKITPDELRVRLGYQNAYADLWHKVNNKEGHVYDHDRDLLNELLQKFFSESFRAKYFQADRNAQAGYRAFQERMYGTSKGNQPNTSTAPTSQPNNASTPNGSSGRQPSGASTGSDSSIAKARAANIDTKVLGLSLGEPLRLPSCGPVLSLSVPTETCVQQELSDALGLGAVAEAFGMGSASPTAEELRTQGMSVSFVPDACPAWMSECAATAMTYDGVLVAIDIKTKGHNVDQAVVKDLRAKYGPPTSIKPITVTPKVGNPFKANSLEWLLPGLHVVYEAIIKGANEGEVANVENGDIGFETEAAYHRRLAKEKAKPKPKL